VSELWLTAEAEQVELGTGPVTVVVVSGPVETGWARRLAPMGALKSRDEEEGQQDEDESGHGGNYPSH
jgi:hypothetical protein